MKKNIQHTVTVSAEVAGDGESGIQIVSVIGEAKGGKYIIEVDGVGFDGPGTLELIRTLAAIHERMEKEIKGGAE